MNLSIKPELNLAGDGLPNANEQAPELNLRLQAVGETLDDPVIPVNHVIALVAENSQRTELGPFVRMAGSFELSG
ncbi:MAG: hypothetical protein ACREQV_17435 [Candidatus Binatia bacterium]